jgi:hypothetical protein
VYLITSESEFIMNVTTRRLSRLLGAAAVLTFAFATAASANEYRVPSAPQYYTAPATPPGITYDRSPVRSPGAGSNSEVPASQCYYENYNPDAPLGQGSGTGLGRGRLVCS